MDEEELMLTTIDNPFNPFLMFDEWYSFDVQQGYNTCSYLARIARTSSEMSENIEKNIITQAVKEIANFNLSGKHIAVSKSDFDAQLARAKSRLSS